MATSGSMTTNAIDSGTYFYVNWQQSSQDTANNRTLINYQFGVHCRWDYYYNAIRVDNVNINGSQVKGSETYSNLGQGDHQLGSGSMWIGHNSDGNKTFNISMSGWVYDAGTSTGSQNFSLNKINRYAVTNSVTGSDIEGIFKVNYTKYINDYKYKLRISIPGVRALETIDYETSNEEFTLSQATIQDLFTTYSDKNTFSLGFAVESWNSAGTSRLSSGNEKIITCSIVDANPIFSNFEFEDINTTTTALTGNNKYSIDGYSNIKVSISTANKATAQKGASISKYRFTCGTNIPAEANYSSDSTVELTIEGATSGTFNVYAMDTRGNTTLVTKLATQEIVYTPISINATNSKVERSDGGIGDSALLTYSGTIWNSSFGSVTNSVKASSYRYKATDSEQWITPSDPTDITPALSQNSFSFSDLVRSNEEDYKFDLQKNYDFEIQIQDELSSYSLRLSPMLSGIPNLCYADDGMSIMKDYDDNDGGACQIGGDTRIDGDLYINGNEISYLNDVKVYTGTSSISFTAPFDGIIDITGIYCGWGYAGGQISMTIGCTTGSSYATSLGNVDSATDGHDTSAVPLVARKIYSIQAGKSYTFNKIISGSVGGVKSEGIVGVLRRGQSVQS